jgi:hypothetical protein
MTDPEKDDINRAKQALSPASLGDRSDKATTLPGNDSPDDSPMMDRDAHGEEKDDSILTTNTD